MSLERRIRMLAGTLVLTSLALGHWVSPYWLWLAAFVGANLFQSSITGWCLAENILRKLGWTGPTNPPTEVPGRR